MRIYIAGPITADPYGGVRNAVLAAEQLLDAGHTPFIPHLTALWALIAGDKPHGTWLDYDLRWVEACDALVRLPGDSVGADLEVAHALQRGMHVYLSVREIIEEGAAHA